MSNDIKLEGVDKIEAENEVKEIFLDRYGEDDVRSFKSMGDPVIRAKGYDDKVRVKSDSEGNAVVDVSEASPTTQGLVSNITAGPEIGQRDLVKRSVEQYEEENKEDAGGVGSSSNTTDRSGSDGDGGIGDHDVVDFGDGSIRFRPAFSQVEASYLEPGDSSYDDSHGTCDACAHYIEGGGCHMVEGPIEDEAYCEELYADVGVYGHKHDEGVEENLFLWGWDFNWDEADAKEFGLDVKENIERKIRGLVR